MGDASGAAAEAAVPVFHYHAPPPSLFAGVSEAAAVAVQELVYLIGGVTKRGLSDTFFRLNVETRVVEEITLRQASGSNAVRRKDQSLSRRSGHSMSLYRERYLFVFGGHNAITFVNTCHLIDLDQLTFEALNFTGRQPSPRAEHSACMIGSKVYVFGGKNENGVLSDMHVLHADVKRWMQPGAKGEVPKARSGHSAVEVGGLMYLFGGEGRRAQFFNDLFSYDPATRTWQSIACKGAVPSPRTSHSVCVIGNRMFVFGGRCGRRRFNDCYAFDTRQSLWYQVVPDQSFPSPLSNACCMSIAMNVVIIGGSDGRNHSNMWWSADPEAMSMSAEALPQPEGDADASTFNLSAADISSFVANHTPMRAAGLPSAPSSSRASPLRSSLQDSFTSSISFSSAPAIAPAVSMLPTSSQAIAMFPQNVSTPASAVRPRASAPADAPDSTDVRVLRSRFVPGRSHAVDASPAFPAHFSLELTPGEPHRADLSSSFQLSESDGSDTVTASSRHTPSRATPEARPTAVRLSSTPTVAASAVPQVAVGRQLPPPSPGRGVSEPIDSEGPGDNRKLMLALSQLNHVRSELATERERNENLQSSLTEVQDKLFRESQHQHSSDLATQSLHAELQASINARETLASDLRLAREDLAREKALVQRLERDLSESDARSSGMRRSVEEARAEADKARAQAHEMQLKLRNQNRQSAVDVGVQAHDDELAALRSRVSALQSQLDASGAQAASLRDEAQLACEERDEARTLNATLSEARDYAQAQLDALKERAAAQIRELRTQVSALTAERVRDDTRVQRKTDEVLRLRAQLKSLAERRLEALAST